MVKEVCPNCGYEHGEHDADQEDSDPSLMGAVPSESSGREREGTVAVVPCRTGSERLPGKNRRMINGIPLWAISAIQGTLLVDEEVYILTNDEEIEIQLLHGIPENGTDDMVLHRRPSKFDEPDARSEDLFKWFMEHATSYEEYLWLQPTSPCRSLRNIKSAIDNHVPPIISKDDQKEPNGSFYHLYWDFFREDRFIRTWHTKSRIDIDTYWDYRLAKQEFDPDKHLTLNE